MNIERLSTKYQIRKLTEDDIEIIYQLEINNPLFYEYCPPFVTRESIQEDMKALPPRKTYDDKYYIGFFDQEKLVAIMDLILKYPNDKTAFIGFFMMNQDDQGKSVGTSIIDECVSYLKSVNYEYIRLGYVKGNPQSQAFWVKNGFIKTGIEDRQENYTVVIMERELIRHEKSCGAVVYTYINNQRSYLIVKMLKGHYGFPKGHVETNETEIKTALREIKEETGLAVELDTSFRETVEYSPYADCIKEVVFFIGKSKKVETTCQIEEIKEIQWLTYDNAIHILSYENDKETLRKAEIYLNIKERK